MPSIKRLGVLLLGECSSVECVGYIDTAKVTEPKGMLNVYAIEDSDGVDIRSVLCDFEHDSYLEKLPYSWDMKRKVVLTVVKTALKLQEAEKSIYSCLQKHTFLVGKETDQHNIGLVVYNLVIYFDKVSYEGPVQTLYLENNLLSLLWGIDIAPFVVYKAQNGEYIKFIFHKNEVYHLVDSSQLGNRALHHFPHFAKQLLSLVNSQNKHG